MTQNDNLLSVHLAPLGLSDWRYFPVTTSTNDLALAWAAEGAQDFSLVLADAQTAGRGRENRKWVTHPGAALAFSLILKPTMEELPFVPRFTALAALSLLDALGPLGLKGELKWPNDVLLSGKKVAGVLVEADWQADRVSTLVVGMGVNITPDAVPRATALRFPATSVESELGREVDRWAILASILHSLKRYRDLLTTADFIQLWNAMLAFQGKTVRFRFLNGDVRALTVLGVQSDGCLALRTQQGEIMQAVAGEIELVGRGSKGE